MQNEIMVKIILDESYKVDTSLYLDIINGLNDRLVPVNEITLNNKIVFTNTEGFTER